MAENYDLYVIWDLVKNTFGQKKPKYYRNHDWAVKACEAMNIKHKLPVTPPRDRFKVVVFAMDWKSQVKELINYELPDTKKKVAKKDAPKKEKKEVVKTAKKDVPKKRTRAEVIE